MKKIIKTDIHLRVDPGPYYIGNPSEETIETDCEDIKRQMKRHVDGYQYCGVNWTDLEVCSFCGEEWEEDEEGPLCCKRAVKEWEKEGD